MLAIKYRLQLSGGSVEQGLSWHQSLIPRHAEMQRKCYRVSQNVTKELQLYDHLNVKKWKVDICICIFRMKQLCDSVLMSSSKLLTVLTVWIFLTNCTEPMIKSFLSSKVATQSNRHQLSLFNRKSPFDRELSYKFAFMRYFYPNLYAKIIKIQIRNPACID